MMDSKIEQDIICDQCKKPINGKYVETNSNGKITKICRLCYSIIPATLRTHKMKELR